MKILASLISIMLFITYCSAAANRSTVWMIANNQIYSTGYGYQSCTTNPGLTASSVSFLSTTKLAVTGRIVNAKGETTDTTGIPNNAILTTLSIVFYYNSSHYLTLYLNAPATPITISSLLTTPASSASTGNFIYATPSSFPINVITGNRILSPVGTAWLDFSTIQEVYISTTVPATAFSFMIVDYISSSTIAITQFSDVLAGDAAAAEATNSFFSFGIRTYTSSISASTILSSSGCTTSGRKRRSLEHEISKRYITSCPSSALDASMTTTVLSSMCTAANSIYATTSVQDSKTSSNMQDAVARAVNAINALAVADAGYFSAATTAFKFVNCGLLLTATLIGLLPFY